MALLRLKSKEPRSLSIYGNFSPGETKVIPDEQARNLVIANPDMWEIVTPPKVEEARRKKYAETRKFDTKKEE